MFKTKYEPPKTIVTNTVMPSKTDTTKAETTDIYALIEKYGIKSLINKNRPDTELYIDTTIIPKNMTLAEAVQTKRDFEKYFREAPSKFRKLFKDNPDEFYLAYTQGEYDRLISAGALTKEQVELQKNALKEEMRPLTDKILQYETSLKEEKAKNERLNALLNTQQNTQSIQDTKTNS